MTVTCLYGDLGKTHLAHLWHERVQAHFLTPADMLSSPRDWHDSADYFVADRWEALCHDETWWFHYYNWLREQKKYLLLLADHSPQQWQITLLDLASRVKTAHAIALLPPDDETRAIIFEKILRDHGLFLKPYQMEYLLRRIDRSYAGLERCAKQLRDWVGRLSYRELESIVMEASPESAKLF